MNWYIEAFKKYAVFDGRARRKEYWMFILFNCIIVSVLAVAVGEIYESTGSLFALSVLYSFAVLIPSLAVSVRRLHDTGRSGWWLLIYFVPFMGFIVLLIFAVLDSQAGENQYGPNPKGVTT